MTASLISPSGTILLHRARSTTGTGAEFFRTPVRVRQGADADTVRRGAMAGARGADWLRAEALERKAAQQDTTA
jgi:hypothetical protein